MTQPVKQDERVLDYIYGELDDGERTAFEATLAEDAALRAEVESLQGVSKAFRGLPKLTQSPESVHSMTALLMQQATQMAGGHAENAARSEAARIEAEGGAKVIPLRSRSLRRIFASPASGIFAAAAAALLWVVVKSQTPLPVSSPNENPKFEPTAMAPPAPAVAASLTTETAQPMAQAPTSPNVPIKEAFDEALKKERAAPSKLDPAPDRMMLAMGDRATEKPKRGTSGKLRDELDSMFDGSVGKKPAEKKAESKPLIVAMAPNYDKKKSDSLAMDDAATQRFASPPPPMRERAEEPAAMPTKPTVRQQMAQAGDRRKDRIVEELANQELGNLPGRAAGAGAAAPAAPPPPPVTIAQNEAESGRYAQRETPAPAASPPADELRGNTAAAPTEAPSYAQNAPQNAPQASSPYVQNSAPRRVVSGNDTEAGSALLQTVQEQLRQGRCAEANSSLSRIEQSFPATSGLAEMRAQFVRTCPTNLNQNQNLVPVTPSPAAPAPMKSSPRTMEFEQNYAPRSSMSKSPVYRSKKAAPAPTQHQQQQQQKARSVDKAASEAVY